MKTYLTILLATITLLNCSPKSSPTSHGGKKIGQSAEVTDKNISWESFDPNSSVALNNIQFQNLQGSWAAYKGVFLFNGSLKSMELTQPFIIEIKDQSYRRNNKEEFKSFTLSNNLFNSKDDVGVINKITSTELTITWKNNANYTRYFYKK